MSPELGMQLADVGLKTIDGIGNLWADKINEKKRLEDLREQNELMEAYAERINGPGSGGGTASGHAKEFNYLDYFGPAISSLAATAYYQASTNIGDAIAKKVQQKKTGEADKIGRPSPSLDAKAEPLDNTISSNIDPNLAGNIASNDQQGWFQALGMYPTTSPVGKTSQVTYNAGMDPEIMKLFGKIMLNGGGEAALGTLGSGAGGAAALALLKKGSKLIPRQK